MNGRDVANNLPVDGAVVIALCMAALSGAMMAFLLTWIF